MHKPELLTQAEQDELENSDHGEYDQNDQWTWYGYVTIDREIYANIDRMWALEASA